MLDLWLRSTTCSTRGTKTLACAGLPTPSPSSKVRKKWMVLFPAVGGTRLCKGVYPCTITPASDLTSTYQALGTSTPAGATSGGRRDSSSPIVANMVGFTCPWVLVLIPRCPDDHRDPGHRMGRGVVLRLPGKSKDPFSLNICVPRKQKQQIGPSQNCLSPPLATRPHLLQPLNEQLT